MPTTNTDAAWSAAKLRAALHAKLKTSGLTPADAKRLKLTPLTRAQSGALKVLPFVGFKIPYFWLNGQPMKFFRVRYLEATHTGQWDAITNKKTPRYSQPPGTGVELYAPPLISWPKVLDKPEQQLIITEGELKAACACKHGLPTVALGGVWSFKATARGELYLPALKELRLKGRAVYVAFDSDALTNPQVQQAEQALCRALLSYGATPHIVRLPALEEGAKTGLDDYLIARGDRDFMALMEKAEPYARAATLHQLNAEVVYVRVPGLVMRQRNLQRLSTDAFVKHAYSTWTYPEETVKADGSVVVKEAPAAAAWLKWPGRFEVERVTYAPGQPRFLPATDELNTWRGWGATPAKGSAARWTQLLDHLFSGAAPEARQWFEQWCAYPLQNPGTKLYSAAVLWGVNTGTGKSLVGYSLIRLYGENATEIDDEALNASFNEWAENKQFVMGDDVTSGENKRQLADKLKFMITRQQLRLNPKFVPSYTVPDCINYYFTSNHPDAFYLEDDDRRMFVHEITVPPLAAAFYEDYVKWLESDAGAAALFDHLLRVDLTGFNPKAPALITDAKLTMIDDMRSELGTWVSLLRTDPDSVLGKDTGDLWTPKELLAMFDPSGVKRVTPSVMGRELKRQRVPTPGHRVITTKLGSVRVVIVRKVQRWLRASHDDLAKHYAQSRSDPTAHADRPAGKTKKFTVVK